MKQLYRLLTSSSLSDVVVNIPILFILCDLHVIKPAFLLFCGLLLLPVKDVAHIINYLEYFDSGQLLVE